MRSLIRLPLTVALVLLVVASLMLAGCASNKAKETPPEETTTSQSEATTTPEEDGLYTPTYQPNGNEVAVIKTNKGDITVQLYGKDAPIHVGNFVELAKKGFYDGTKFHRYIAGFVVQGGDPNTRDASSAEVAAEAAKGDGGGKYGTGGPGYQIKGEFDPATNPRKHVKGALGMARSNMPDSAGSQFYFALDALPDLDGNYTVFGQVTAGMDVMESLRAGDTIESITIQGADG